mmetsp:Transcript_92891/g.300411  ORF Transcript_92891/g.300411 Transcript_92891/m.300411 type:complete len:350 (-) Transcript_92891:1062-2111(-)
MCSGTWSTKPWSTLVTTTVPPMALPTWESWSSVGAATGLSVEERKAVTTTTLPAGGVATSTAVLTPFLAIASTRAAVSLAVLIRLCAPAGLSAVISACTSTPAKRLVPLCCCSRLAAEIWTLTALGRTPAMLATPCLACSSVTADEKVYFTSTLKLSSETVTDAVSTPMDLASCALNASGSNVVMSLSCTVATTVVTMTALLVVVSRMDVIGVVPAIKVGFPVVAVLFVVAVGLVVNESFLLVVDMAVVEELAELVVLAMLVVLAVLLMVLLMYSVLVVLVVLVVLMVLVVLVVIMCMASFHAAYPEQHGNRKRSGQEAQQLRHGQAAAAVVRADAGKHLRADHVQSQA